MREAFRDVIEFDRARGVVLSGDRPRAPTAGVGRLRERLLREEFCETMEAIYKGDVAALADGLADLIYVCIGTALAYGVDLAAAWDAVHESNMRKFGPGSWVREDGKIMKPPNWQPPDIAGILAAQRPLAEIYGADTAGASDPPPSGR